jgi:hypothetical protein
MLGAEQAGWRSLLASMGVRNVGMSYWAARRRLPKKKPYSMDWGFERVFLDSGGFGANKEPEKMTQREWRAYGHEFADFALEHIDEVEIVSEFDCLALGPAWIQQMRDEVWDEVPAEKFMPIWHPEHGLDALTELGERYRRIGIAQDHIALPGMNITPHLNRLAQAGVHLHGLAMSRPDAIRHVRFASVSSTSWLSAMRYGETLIWDGARLARYPMKMKQQARDRHRHDFERAGFDVELIAADDPNEVTRVAIWSWLQYEASVNGERVTPSVRKEAGEEAENGDAPVIHGLPSVRNEPATVRVRDESEMQRLPVFGYSEHEALDTDSDATRKYLLPIVNQRPLRACNTCYVRAECPGFAEDTTCKFDVPIEVRTPAQKRALINSIIEIQGQRVAFLRFKEELSGGYADPNLSQEMDRLIKFFATQAEIEDDRDFLRVNVEARGKAGVLSRLFGEKAADEANQLPRPLGREDTDRLLGRVIKGETE